MPDDYRKKIDEIRQRRGRESYSKPGQQQPPQRDVPGFDPSQGLGARPRAAVSAVGLEQVQEVNDAPNLMEGIKSPWLRDRVTLSLEGQIAMIEQRTAQRVSTADLGYTNRIPILGLRPGMFVKLEPPGTYRLTYHNRF